jgi:hypothetical protein
MISNSSRQSRTVSPRAVCIMVERLMQRDPSSIKQLATYLSTYEPDLFTWALATARPDGRAGTADSCWVRGILNDIKFICDADPTQASVIYEKVITLNVASRLYTRP